MQGTGTEAMRKSSCAVAALLRSVVIWCACGYGAQAANKTHLYRKYVVGDFEQGTYSGGLGRHLLERESSQGNSKVVNVAMDNWCPIATLMGIAFVFILWFVKRNWEQWFPPPAPPEPWLLIEDSARVSPRPERQTSSGPRELRSPFERCALIPMTAPTPIISRSLRATRSSESRRLIDCGRFGCVEKGLFVDASGKGHDVAVKTARAGEDLDVLLETFTAEIQCFERLPHHPNVIQCFGCRLGEDTGPGACVDEIFIVEELMDMSLRDIIAGSNVPWETWTYTTVLRIFKDIAVGLEHLHTHNISHYDLKPENVLVRVVDGGPFPLQIKLADFGCSQLRQKPYATAKYAGTKLYMAPEIAWSLYYSLMASGKIDVYSLGIMMWEVLTGGNMIAGGCPIVDKGPPHSMQGLLDCPCEQRWPIGDNHPAELSKLIWSCLELDSSNRSTAKMVLEAIECMMVSEWVGDEVIRERALCLE